MPAKITLPCFMVKEKVVKEKKKKKITGVVVWTEKMKAEVGQVHKVILDSVHSADRPFE